MSNDSNDQNLEKGEEENVDFQTVLYVQPISNFIN